MTGEKPRPSAMPRAERTRSTQTSGPEDFAPGVHVHKIPAVDPKRLRPLSGFADTVLIGNVPPMGFTMLFDGNFTPLRAANAYLHAKVTDAHRRNSQKAFADDLAQWFTFLGGCGLEWDKVSTAEIKNFRHALAHSPSPATGRVNAPATIARRIGTVLDFYEWAYADRRIDEAVVPVDTEGAEIPKPRAKLAHAGTKRRRGSGDDSLKSDLPEKDEDVRPIALTDLKRILEKLGPDPRNTAPDPDAEVWIRDRVMAEVALFTGMRVMEVCGLTVNQVDDLRGAYDPLDPFKHVPLRLLFTKGRRKRTVLVHCALIAALINYVDVERRHVLEKTAERAAGKKKRGTEPRQLFLNHASANLRDAGRPVSADTASRIFAKAVKSCGLYRVEDAAVMDAETGLAKEDPETGFEMREQRRFAKHTFHDLRHTFATQFYMSEVKAGRLAPWKRLQTLLGHRLMSTTMDIYVRHCDVTEAMYSDAFAKRLSEGADAVVEPVDEDFDADA